VLDRRIAIGFRWGGRKGPLAAGKVEHRASPVDPPSDQLGQGIAHRGGACEFGIAQGQAEQIRDFERVQHRAACGRAV
jgi:hypothetical protein